MHLRNFGCVLDRELPCDILTALVGRNGTGKSTYIRAIELFFASTPKVELLDFYAERIDREIEIAITFTGLRPEELERFKSYLEEQDLAVIRVFTNLEGKIINRYHGYRLGNSEFTPIRTATKAADQKLLYEQLRKDPKYKDLPGWGNRDQAMSALREWEGRNARCCTRMRDDGQFFGFAEVAQGYLGRHTQFVPVPAVRDASAEAEEGKGSAFTTLIDAVVRSALADHSRLKALREETRAKYMEILGPLKEGQLKEVQTGLTQTLRNFVSEAEVLLDWEDQGEIEIPMPQTVVRLSEDGYRSSVGRTGHGLQRAFLLALLQQLAVATRRPTASDSAESSSEGSPQRAAANAALVPPDLIIAIEEPELYQHPSRQRYFAEIFRRLAAAERSEKSGATQIIYATHSPMFVGLEQFDSVRLFQKVKPPEEGPKVTKITRVSLDEVADQLWVANGRPEPRFTGASLKPRLRALLTPWMNEGFFAELVVLVEGEGDRAALLGMAAAKGIILEGLGISIIPCFGKTCIDRPKIIFEAFNIPVYAIWDSDFGGESPSVETNRLLLRLMGATEEEDYPTRITDIYACFQSKLEDTLRSEIGAAAFDDILRLLQVEFDIPRRELALKNPMVLEHLVRRAADQGSSSKSLETILDKILKLLELQRPGRLATARLALPAS